MSDTAYRQLVNNTKQLIAKSKILTRIVISFYFHSRHLLKYRLSDTTRMHKNGEELIISLVADKIDCFVDAGANVGRWTNLLKKYLKAPVRGILYEPSPTVFSTLNKNIENQEKLIFRQFAVGEKDGKAILHENPNSPSLGSLVYSKGSTEYTEVELVCLDTDLVKLGIEKVDFLKIDTEGYDFQVLKGASQLLKKQAIGLIEHTPTLIRDYSLGFTCTQKFLDF